MDRNRVIMKQSGAKWANRPRLSSQGGTGHVPIKRDFTGDLCESLIQYGYQSADLLFGDDERRGEEKVISSDTIRTSMVFIMALLSFFSISGWQKQFPQGQSQEYLWSVPV
jgi:hypothetical protein